MTEAVDKPAKPRSFLRRSARALGITLRGAILGGISLWGALAICYADLSGASPRFVRAAVFLIAALAATWFLKPRRYARLATVAAFLLVLAWYFSINPSNDRDWAPDVAMLCSVQIEGNRMTVHNVRNFDYRTETEFTPVWEERTYDLDKLRSVDYVLCYWGSKSVAHAIASFGFDDGQYLAISIETRKEKSESFSTIQGFFRQYELIYIVADERDVLRLRTNYRKEDVYVYHTRANPDETRKMLQSYVKTINSLRDHPEFYNALTSNCITSIVPHAQAGVPSAHMGWELLLSGYAARQAYRNGRLDDSIPFEQLEARSRINDAAVAADKDPDFSGRIRIGLLVPGPDAPR